MKNILMTGGTGFVGTWMQKKKPVDCNIFAMDRYDYEKNYFEDAGDIDYVVHLAPTAPRRALICAKHNHARMLYCSSGCVYHPENDTEYRQNKIKWEGVCLDSGADVVIARLFAFCGVGHMRPGEGKAMKTFFENARVGKPLEVWGDCTRSFMFGARMAEWMWSILFHGESREAYDVGSDLPMTILRLAQRISAFTGCEIKQVDQPISVPVYLPENTQKTKALLECSNVLEFGV